MGEQLRETEQLNEDLVNVGWTNESAAEAEKEG